MTKKEYKEMCSGIEVYLLTSGCIEYPETIKKVRVFQISYSSYIAVIRRIDGKEESMIINRG